MEPPIDRFRRAMNSLPEEHRKNLILMCCFALGSGQNRNDVEDTGDIPVGQLYHALTVDDLCRRLEMLVDEVGMMEEMLIPGVLHYLVEHFETNADRDIESDRIDRNLRMLERMEAELKLPVDDRLIPIPDGRLKQMIQTLKDAMIRGPKYTQECQDIADTIRHVWDEYFPRSYWREWMEYPSRRR